MLIIIHVRCTHALHARITGLFSRISKGPRANNCHGPRLALIRHWCTGVCVCVCGSLVRGRGVVVPAAATAVRRLLLRRVGQAHLLSDLPCRPPAASTSRYSHLPTYQLPSPHLPANSLLRPDLRNIVRCYDYLVIMTKIRSTYDGRLIYKTSCEEHRARLTCKIVRSSEIVFVY